ncbi:MAG TPA: hypothetical protein VH573_11880 [Mycobacteriales bacterium]
MRRSTWVVGLGVVAVVVAGAVSASAAPTAATPAQSTAKGTVLRYDIAFRPFQENFVDVGTPGAGIGDMLVFQDRILDHGRQVGVQGGTCTITALLDGGHFQTHCVGTVSLAAGQIAFQGLVTDAPDKHMAVVGGTGRYRDAGGELTVLELGNDVGTLTVRLTAHSGR